VANALDAPLDVFVIRKLGTPGQPELAMGAIAPGGVRVLNEDVVRQMHIPDEQIESVVQQEIKELKRREHLYRSGRPVVVLKDKTVILIDDGLATGATMQAAVIAIRKQNPREIIVAVPVATPTMCDQLGSEVEQIICVKTPEPFISVGTWYDDFSQITDDEVIRLLSRAQEEQQG
jgi:putative phosphoribosyl transferase